MNKSYKELIQIPDFIGRFKYLKINGKVGDMTFGGRRSLNQHLYKLPEWRRVRNIVIERDKACDLAHSDRELTGRAAYIHHINPITVEDILNRDPKVLDPDNLITTSFDTHQAIHYGDYIGILYQNWCLRGIADREGFAATCPNLDVSGS